MRKCILVLGAVGLGGLCAASNAALTTYTRGPAANFTTDWPASQEYGTLPVWRGVDMPWRVAGTASPNQGVDMTLATGAAHSVSFNIASDVTIGAISIVTVGAVHTGPRTSIHIYKLNLSPGVGGYMPGGTGDVVDINNPGLGDDDWLGGGQGLSFTYPGYGQRNVLEFSLSGADQVTLTPGHYVMELWNHMDTEGSIYWTRGVGSSTYRYYQSASNGASTVVQASTIARNNTHGDGRPGSLAIYPIPEPGALALLGLGAAGLTARRRRD